MLKGDFDRLSLSNKIDRTQKHLELVRFDNLIRRLLPVDYALLIQRDPATRKKSQYNLSHFHIHIDWPIGDAATALARILRYISKDIDEKGEKYAEDVLKKIPCMTTVSIGNSEVRALIRISERGVTKGGADKAYRN